MFVLEGVGDGGSRTFAQDGGDACVDARWTDCFSATAPYFREDVDGSRDILGLGHSRPPEALYHPRGWEQGDP